MLCVLGFDETLTRAKPAREALSSAVRDSIAIVVSIAAYYTIAAEKEGGVFIYIFVYIVVCVRGGVCVVPYRYRYRYRSRRGLLLIIKPIRPVCGLLYQKFPHGIPYLLLT